VEGVDVIAEVRDRTGRLLRRETIGNEDLWRDVDDKYPTVECSNDVVRVSCPDNLPTQEDWIVRKDGVAARNAS
jgi:hypothetical protein